MDNKMIEYCVEQYRFELEQQENFNNYTGLYIGFFGVLLSGMCFPYSDLEQIQNFRNIWAIGAIFFYILAIIAIFGFIYFILKVQTGLEYQRIPHSKELLNYYKDLGQKENIQEIICEEYANASFHNFNVNLKKSSFFRYAKFCLLILVIAELLSYLDYHFIKKNDKIVNVKLYK